VLELWTIDLNLFYFLALLFFFSFFIYFISVFIFIILDLDKEVWCDIMCDSHISHKAWHMSQSQITKSCDIEKNTENSRIDNII